MHNDVVLSIIVLSYNHERYIERALDSVLSQKVSFAIEIIVGDDASTDNTPKILKKYKKDFGFIQLVLREKNVGANINAFKLLSNTKGKYIAILDGDDYWIDNYKLQKQVDFLESNKDYVGVANKSVCVDENGNEIVGMEVPWVKFKECFTVDDFDGFFLPGQTSSIVKKNFFNDNKHDMSIIYKTHPFLGDRFSILIYLCEGNIGGIDSYMTAYRIHNDSKQSHNLTNLLNKDISKRVKSELQVTKTMECYALSQNKKLFFCEYRKKLLRDAVYAYCRNEIEKYDIINELCSEFRVEDWSVSFLLSLIYKQIGIKGLVGLLKRRMRAK